MRALLDGTGARAGTRVLDLGAGTGKLTRSLKTEGMHVAAVDPVFDMLVTLRTVVGDVPVVAGTAESIPLRTSSVGAVFCAAAFHWFRTTEALSEIHRVLEPSGGIGLVWNRRDLSVGWVSRLWGGLIDPHRGSVPAHDSFEWRDVLEASDLFGPTSETHVSHTQPCDVDTLIARLDSTSFINTLARPKKDELFARVRDFCATDPDLAGRQNVDIPYRTHVYTCRRT